MTDTDRETVAAIKDHIAEYGYPPSVRELAKRLGLASTSAALARLRSAEESGAISRVGPRRFIVVEEP